MMRTRLDRVAWAAIACLLMALAIIMARGDQLGAQVISATPASGSSDVSARPALSFTFSEAMNPAEIESRLRIEPPLSATLRAVGRAVFVDLAAPLLPNTQYTVTLKAGAKSQRGRVQLRDFSLAFRTRSPQVLYLAPASGTPNLFAANPDGSSIRQLTSEAFGVFDFAISPDGNKIAYSVTRNADGIRDIWLMNTAGGGRQRIVTCDDQACQYPTWSADGSRMAFERRSMITGTVGRTPGAARIWQYDVNTKELAPLSGDSQQLGALPRFAPAGNALAFYDSVASVIVIVDTQTGAQQTLPSLLGDTGEWSPDGAQLIFPDLISGEMGDYSQLFRADLARGVITPFITLSTSADISASWSPLGNAVAFSRQDRAAPVPAGSFGPIGPQIWVAQADGTRARQITREAEFSFGGLAWSPDGQWIAAVRINLLTPDARPEVWLAKADGSAQRRIAQDATLPAWLP
ncbi:MAG: Ig-like domain-containing protein [Anaerolineae bacterium]|nr:Ig-like domain-containing protein [Thermoflexales bacterium]HQW35160.1 Ig-like domain-containing protein [Thermoflexales bacterium]